MEDNRTIEQKKQEEINRLETLLSAMIEPSNEELILFGKTVHPYYVTIKRLETLSVQ